MLVLKLVLTPLLLMAVTSIGRHLGPRVAGITAGLPLTSGPISLCLALEQGPAFAQRAAAGTIAGLVAVCGFCTAYALCADSKNWLQSLSAGLVAFATASLILSRLSLGLALATVLALGSVPLGLALISSSTVANAQRPPSVWDLAGRTIVATMLVLLLTEGARTLGPEMTGLLSPFPLFAALLASFTHVQSGGSSARELLRGIVAGTPSFVAFFVCVGVGLGTLGVIRCYLLAAIVTAATQVLATRSWARAAG